MNDLLPKRFEPIGANLTPDQKYNFISNLIDSAGWIVAMAFFSTSTIAPAYLSKLGANSLVIGLLPAIVTIGYTVPGIFTANHVSSLPRVRNWLFVTAWLERVPLLLMGVAALTINSHLFLLCSFIGLYAVHSVLLGINQPAYWVMVAKSVPTLWRGRLFGFAGLIAGVGAIAVLPITDYYLRGDSERLIHGFGWCFVIGSVIEFVSVMPLGLIREPVSDIQSAQPVASSSRLVEIWRSNSRFRQFMWGQIFFSIWSIGGPFYLLDGIRNLQVAVGEIGVYAFVGVIVSALGGSLCGIVSDRSGNRVILLAGCVTGAVASVYALAAPSANALTVVFALAAFASTATGLAGMNVTMEFAPTEQAVPHYSSLYNVVLAPVRAAALIAGGFISQSSDYTPVFIVSALAAVVSFIVTLYLVEPRHTNISGRIEEPRL